MSRAISSTASVCSDMSTGPSTTLALAESASSRLPATTIAACTTKRAAPLCGIAREASGR